jgi:hypothetical protein
MPRIIVKPDAGFIVSRKWQLIQRLQCVVELAPPRSKLKAPTANVIIDPLQLPKVLIAGVKSATTCCSDDESNEHGAWRRGIRARRA